MSKSLKESLSNTNGELVIIKPSVLATEGKTGMIATGIYEGTSPDKYDASKVEYKIRAADNTLYILKETKALRDQFNQLKGINNAKVTVNYNGKVATKNGKGFHDFEVFVD